MRYLSVCSGVGTDHLAWEGLGWECAGFAEIEPFPSAILCASGAWIEGCDNVAQVESSVH